MNVKDNCNKMIMIFEYTSPQNSTLLKRRQCLRRAFRTLSCNWNDLFSVVKMTEIRISSSTLEIGYRLESIMKLVFVHHLHVVNRNVVIPKFLWILIYALYFGLHWAVLALFTAPWDESQSFWVTNCAPTQCFRSASNHADRTLFAATETQESFFCLTQKRYAAPKCG